MYGALLGDMIGAPYEFDRGNKSKEFPLFCEHSRFTDDSVMTIAVAEALLDSRFLDDDSIRAALIKSMRKWGKKYPDAGYGRKFLCWLREKDPKPYGSCGNGSAMRVSAAGWLFDTLEETREKARLTAEVTHDHPEGIKGAEATSSAIFLPGPAAARRRSGITLCRSSVMTSPAPVTRSGRAIITMRAARRRCRKRSLPFWRGRISKMSSGLPFPSAAIVIP